MKIMILVYAKPEVGLGHWYRSAALAKAGKDHDHLVWLTGNRMAHGFNYYQVREDNPDDLYHVLDQVKPDVLVMDLQDKVPAYVYQVIRDVRQEIKTVVLNGVGRAEEDKADLVIIQGYSNTKFGNTYAGPEYVILRPEIFKIPAGARPLSWFVWGGARDKMNLLRGFQDALPGENAILVASEMMSDLPSMTDNHQVYIPEGDAIIPLMGVSKQACIAMGMIAWELTVFDIPIYAFSWSDQHLMFAKEMEANGLLLAWDGVGLPETDQMRAFLSERFSPNGRKPDDQGTHRVIALIEGLKA